jgi:hypothetical protein
MISKNAITSGVLSTTNADGVTRSALKATGAEGGTGAKVVPIVQNGQSPTLWDGSNDMASKERKTIVRTVSLYLQAHSCTLVGERKFGLTWGSGGLWGKNVGSCFPRILRCGWAEVQ